MFVYTFEEIVFTEERFQNQIVFTGREGIESERCQRAYSGSRRGTVVRCVKIGSTYVT